MRYERPGSMTQVELLAELHRLGYHEVTERQLADWRRKGLLPPFDVMGGGRGRRRGRERHRWSKSQAVLDQTLWVRDLLQIYGSVDSIRLPLWMLGYPVPLDKVREALGKHLNEFAAAFADEIEDEARATGEIEDLIEEAAYQNVEEMRRAGAKALLIPQHSLEAFLNVFFNQGYDLTDGAFELGAEELKEYENAMRQRCTDTRDAESVGSTSLARQASSFMSFFDLAPFIKQHFSLHQFKRAVDECTDADLRAVQRDLYFVREMALLFRKIIPILTSEIPAEYKPARTDILQLVLSGGALLVRADLSLRRNGFAPSIDYFLPVALREFQLRFTEDMERELIDASKAVPEAIEANLTKLSLRPS